MGREMEVAKGLEEENQPLAIFTCVVHEKKNEHSVRPHIPLT